MTDTPQIDPAARPTVEINLAYMSMRYASMPDRVAAAASAGFDGIGLRPEAVPALRVDGWHNERIRDELLSHGMKVTEIEPLRIFRDDLLELCEELVPLFAAPRVQVAPPFDTCLDMPAAARWLREAAKRLVPAVLTIEFLPPTGLPDAPTTMHLIEAIDQPNVGLCVDSWHVFRGAGLMSIANLDPRSVSLIQLDDGPLEPELDDYIEDCLRNRRAMGDGEFDLTAFMAMLPDAAPLSVEVISDELDQLAPAEVAARLYSTTIELLAKCRAGASGRESL